jgi:hypothetical protein
LFRHCSSYLPVSISLPSLVDSNSDISLPLQLPPLETPELLDSAELRTLGARSTKIDSTIGRLALMRHKQGSSVVQKKPMDMPKVMSVNETSTRIYLSPSIEIMILFHINTGLSL